MLKKGIDWSLGQANFDHETGIHYGVISRNSVMPECLDDVEYDYGKPSCPKCGNDAYDLVDFGKQNPNFDENDEQWEHAKFDTDDYVCPDCHYIFGSDSAYSDEPLGFTYDQDGYQLTDCLDTDIFVLKSPYYTYAQYCSPCVPGAGNLDTPCDDGVKCYCLGHDWFDDGIAPYPVYRVSDDVQLVAERQDVSCS